MFHHNVHEAETQPSVCIQIKLLDEACEPLQMHSGDAAFDITAREAVIIPPQVRIKIPCGFCMEMPQGYEAQIRPRSGLALKHGITVLNTPGTIDSGYRGEVCAILINTDTKETFEVTKGMRIAQMVIKRVPNVVLQQVEELSDSDRGSGGFGSTGNTSQCFSHAPQLFGKLVCTTCELEFDAYSCQLASSEEDIWSVYTNCPNCGRTFQKSAMTPDVIQYLASLQQNNKQTTS